MGQNDLSLGSRRAAANTAGTLSFAHSASAFTQYDIPHPPDQSFC